MLSLSLGEVIKDPTTNEIPTKGVPDLFSDFIQKCLLKDERERWTASQLLGNEEIFTNLLEGIDFLNKYIISKKSVDYEFYFRA